MLVCGCEDYCPDPGDTIIDTISDYRPAPVTGYRNRCKNCKSMIEKNALCVEAKRFKIAETDVEISIYGEWEGEGTGEIRRASWWLCESCADVLFSLEELGYCVPLDEITITLREYQMQKKAGYL